MLHRPHEIHRRTTTRGLREIINYFKIIMEKLSLESVQKQINTLNDTLNDVDEFENDYTDAEINQACTEVREKILAQIENIKTMTL